MNVFCYPGVMARHSVCSLMGVEQGAHPEFGFRPRTPLHGGKVDRTEIDMKLGNLLIEAKLTEGDFQIARVELIQRYRDFDNVFDMELLHLHKGMVRSYQLLRGILAAAALNGSFCVLCDQRRQDLIEDWYRIVCAVRHSALRCRLKVITWQELAPALSHVQQRFLQEKYGIVS